MSRTPLKKQNINEKNIMDIAYECARFIVFREGSKTCIRRDDIIKHLETTCHMVRSHFKEVLGPAEEILKQVYGYKLVDTGKNSYIVVLNTPCEHHEGIYDPELRIILIAALTHIYMSGGTVTEENMWRFLKEADLVGELEVDKKNILRKTFTEQLYLEYKRLEGEDAECIFKWGLRAENEVPKMTLLKLMSKEFDKEITFWPDQCRIAEEEEQKQKLQ
ncbi:unnamed protein product, partial [Brenthis ino]